jgi:hypothetical protein
VRVGVEIEVEQRGVGASQQGGRKMVRMPTYQLLISTQR